MLTEQEKAWLAGVIDSEGTVWYRDSLDKNEWRIRQCSIEIVNTNLEFAISVQKLLQAVSIYIEERSFSRQKKDLYRVRQHNHSKVLEILVQVLPYLIIKKFKAAKTMQFIQDTDWSRKRFQLKMSEHVRGIFTARVHEGLHSIEPTAEADFSSLEEADITPLNIIDLSEPQKAWLAGVVDSEGGIWFQNTIEKNGWRARRCSVEVVNTNLPFVERTQKLIEAPSIQKTEREGHHGQRPLYKVC